MSLVDATLRYRTLTLVLVAALVVGGSLSFLQLGRLEDPEFTIFTALVTTPYPGASPEEVEQEVTDRLETAIQTMGQVDKVTSISRAGLSLVIVDLKSTTDQDEIPQAWDELRRKVGDLQPTLPPGAGPSQVNDDWGDVYGLYFAVTGEAYDLAELEEYAKLLRRELLLVDNVASVEISGARSKAVWIDIPRAKMAELGLSLPAVVDTIRSQGAVVPDGHLHLDEQYVRVAPTGAFDSVEELGNLLLRDRVSGRFVRLADVATIRSGYVDPPASLVFFDGKPAITIGVSVVPNGNVVELGRAVERRLKELEPQRPLGMALDVISFQPKTVEAAVNGFLVNLVEALAIVIGVLVLFMGPRSGLLIGAVLLLDILGTFVFMNVFDISLQRISLGALIIALGMLVDNAIVVTEGMLVRLQRGVERTKAAVDSVRETMWPLLGATVVAILAFAAISVSEDASGEFLASLFQVIAASLLLSWVLAVTVTPLFGVLFLEAPAADGTSDPYARGFFRAYRSFLRGVLRRRWTMIAATGLALVAATIGFRFVEQSFFPDSSRPQFMIDFWRPEGTHIEDTARDVRRVSDWLLEQDGVESVTAFVGRGGLRFMLTYNPEFPSSAYGQLLVTVDDPGRIDALMQRAEHWMAERFPDAEPRTARFVFGPATGAKIEARVKGDDPAVLRQIAETIEQIMRADGGAKDIRHDWRQRVPVIRPVYAETRARAAGISRPDLARSLELATTGTAVGIYREDDELQPIFFRLLEAQDASASELANAQVWSGVTGQSVPISQVVSEIRTEWEDPIIRRIDRRRTITVQCDPREGVASTLFARLRPRIEALDLPAGYELEWGGEYESSNDANRMLLASVPLFFSLMILIVVGLFNSIRKPLIVFLTLPLAVIGVTAGLLVTGQPFGFVALLGFLSLSGMLIKNSVVLLEQIDLNLAEGMAALDAVLDAGVSRVRPVSMAALTTVLGMVPLLFDRFWAAMAVTIMSGLSFATVLTLIVVPVLYAIAYRVRA
ncbi:MAG: efflux RND transporter permease subunit [Acidobacteria bacterium]|nr:MAG: efflux RND transporter permease subunit [Acidobacteriota bacterium]